MSKGKAYLIISSIAYGIAPVFTVAAGKNGVNSMTITFLRSILSLPVLLIMIRANGVSLKISRTQIRHILILSVFGATVPILTLYLAYSYISTGLATTLHFIYPLVIVLSCAVLYGEKVSPFKMLAVVAVTLGIFMFADIDGPSSKVGIILALISGVFYGFYVLYMDKSGLDDMNYLKLTFYITLFMGITVLISGAAIGGINFKNITIEGWMYSTLVSVIITLISLPLFQLGVRLEGAQTAGILSTLEPLTSITMGRIFLNESISSMQYLGIAMILMGIVILETKELPHKTRQPHH